MIVTHVTPRPNGTQLDKEIAFTLTTLEYAEKAKMVGELTGEIETLEQEKKEFDAAQSQKIKERYERLSAIGKVVREKKEVRLATVIMKKCFETNTVEFWHSEDGKNYELVEERAMEAAERQMDLDDAGVAILPPAKAVKAKKMKPKVTKDESENEIAQEIRSETNKKTKRSAVDGVYG